MACEYYVSIKNSKVIKLYNLHTLIKNLEMIEFKENLK